MFDGKEKLCNPNILAKHLLKYLKADICFVFYFSHPGLFLSEYNAIPPSEFRKQLIFSIYNIFKI